MQGCPCRAANVPMDEELRGHAVQLLADLFADALQGVACGAWLRGLTDEVGGAQNRWHPRPAKWRRCASCQPRLEPLRAFQRGLGRPMQHGTAHAGVCLGRSIGGQSDLRKPKARGDDLRAPGRRRGVCALALQKCTPARAMRQPAAQLAIAVPVGLSKASVLKPLRANSSNTPKQLHLLPLEVPSRHNSDSLQSHRACQVVRRNSRWVGRVLAYDWPSTMIIRAAWRPI